MEYSLCKKLQKICLSERLLQLSYNDPGFKLLDSIKKCNIIFRIEEPQISNYVQKIVLDTNESGVGVNYNMYDFGSFEKLLEALKYTTDEGADLKLPSLSKKLYSNFTTTLCKYICIMTGTDSVIHFLDHIKPFGVFCLDKDVLVDLQPLNRIESTILVHGDVHIHDNIPLVLPLEKVINLNNIDNYACPLPIFCLVAPMPGIFGENLNRFSHQINNVYDFQPTIESTGKIVTTFSNENMSSVLSSVYPKYYTNLPYGMGFYIGTPQMTSYGALKECNKQILSYQDFPLISHLTYTIGSILLGYIYPEGVTFQYDQIKQNDGSYSLYFHSYSYTCQSEWIWETFTKIQLLTDEDKTSLSAIGSDEKESEINFQDRLYQNITKRIDSHINVLEQNIDRGEDTGQDGNIERETEQLEALKMQKQNMIDAKRTLDDQSLSYRSRYEEKIQLQTDLINLLDKYIDCMTNNHHDSQINKLEIQMKEMIKNIASRTDIGGAFYTTSSTWLKKSNNAELIEAVLEKIDNMNITLLLKYQKKLLDILKDIYVAMEFTASFEAYGQLYVKIEYLNSKDSEEPAETEQEAEKQEENKGNEEESDPSINTTKQVSLVLRESSSTTHEKLENSSDMTAGENISENSSTEKPFDVLETSEESIDKKSYKDSDRMTFSSKNITKKTALKCKLKSKQKNDDSKKLKLVEVQDIKSTL